MSCGSWTKAQHSATAQEYQLWMLGFVSGQSVWAGRHGIRVTPTDVTAIYTYVDKYCADHPLDPMVKAGNDLVDELVAKSKP
jgi:hypothetical protein